MEPAVPEVTSTVVTWTYPGSVDAAGANGYIDLDGQHILIVPLATAEIGAITRMVQLLNLLQVNTTSVHAGPL
jgi:hypothetical protein